MPRGSSSDFFFVSSHLTASWRVALCVRRVGGNVTEGGKVCVAAAAAAAAAEHV